MEGNTQMGINARKETQMPETELEASLRHAHHAQEEVVNYEQAGADLFVKPTQQDIIYDFIKTRGRVKSHELNEYSCIMRINNPGSRARELAAKGKIGRMRKDLRLIIYKDCGEEIWSAYPADWGCGGSK